MDAGHNLSRWKQAPGVLSVMLERRQALDRRRTVRTLPGNGSSSPDGQTGPTPPKRVKPSRTYRKECFYCGGEFTSKSHTAKYCNRTHEQYAYRDRKKRRTVEG